jgi:hypothetical protein
VSRIRRNRPRHYERPHHHDHARAHDDHDVDLNVDEHTDDNDVADDHPHRPDDVLNAVDTCNLDPRAGYNYPGG